MPTETEPAARAAGQAAAEALPPTFQDVIMSLQRYWAGAGCVILQPYDNEVGAGTNAPATTLRSLGPDTWRTAYVQGCRRPTDGRYGENPNRTQHYFQFQVLMKPSPDDIQEMYLGSLRAIGIDVDAHDVRFVEDDWESPTLGAWGLGWEVWIDGMEVTQFTYFQQVGGFECNPVPVEIAYGLERLTMFVQGVDSMFDIVWSRGADGVTFTYGDVYLENERQYSTFQLRGGRHRFPVPGVQRPRGGVQAHARGEPAAAGLRQRAQVLPHVQPAGRPRRDICHGAHGLHPARAHAGKGRVRELHGARGGHEARRGRGGGRPWLACIRSPSR